MECRIARVRALLDYADQQQRELSDDYGCYVDSEIPMSLLIKVKNYLENVRSVLDYVAYDICACALQVNERHKCYFPIWSRSQEEFARFCETNFPDLKRVAPDLYSVLLDTQSFRTSEFAALRRLADYTNENKHRDLTAQSIVRETYTASRFMVVRVGDRDLPPAKDVPCDGYLVADETRTDPFLGSDYIIGNIGKVVDLDAASMRYTSFKLAKSGEDVIITLMNIQNAVAEVVERFSEPLYGVPRQQTKRA